MNLKFEIYMYIHCSSTTYFYKLSCMFVGIKCRENVEGRRCDRCRENTYDKQAGCRGESCPQLDAFLLQFYFLFVSCI